MRPAIVVAHDKFERWADTDEVGVIMISGPNVFKGYLIDSQNKGIFNEIDGKTWLNTGDLGCRDAGGYFWLTGRKKKAIIRGGHNIDPKVIEEAMHMHHSVAAAAVGRPDAKAGELPVLYYTLHSGAELPYEELLKFATENIPERAAIPKDFIWLPEIAQTAVGKINKVVLNMKEIGHTVRAEADRLGLELAALDVVQDSQRGIVAKVDMTSGDEDTRRALGQFAFAFDLV